MRRFVALALVCFLSGSSMAQPCPAPTPWLGSPWDDPCGTLGPDKDNPETACFTFCTSYNPDLPAGCQRKAPKGLNGRGTPLWLYKAWTSLDLTGMVAKILMRDVLGYRNITLAWGAWKFNLVTPTLDFFRGAIIFTVYDDLIS